MKDYFVYKQIVAFLLVVACFTIIILAEFVKRNSHIEASLYLALLPLCVLHLAFPGAANPRLRGNGMAKSEPAGFCWNRSITRDARCIGSNRCWLAAAQFIDKMVAKHSDQAAASGGLSQAKRLNYVLRLMDRQAPTDTPTGRNRRVRLIYYAG